MKKNQSGFSLIEVLIVLVIVLVIAGAGFVILKRDKDSSKNSLPVSLDGITITSPSNNSTVGRNFNIIGKVKTGAANGFSLVIDSKDEGSDGGEWFYINSSNLYTTNTSFNVHKNDTFDLPVNLNGNKVLEYRTPVVGGYTYKYYGLAAGKHTFKLTGYGGCTSVCGAMFTNPGPTITLDVK
jgi:prepilin-type N-terminal cleavage/methylation domain-containing protein